MNQYKPWTATEVTANTTDVQGVVADDGLLLMAVSVREGAAGAATGQLHHGTGTGDPVVDIFALAANGHIYHSFAPNGIPCANGVYVNRLTGNTHLVLYTVSGD